ncbi:MAG: hypothetical protein R3C25_07590 [Hyphomonadaceae bacterium]
MTALADIEAALSGAGSHALTRELVLSNADRILETWLEAHGKPPTQERREGFRLLALHRQAAQGDPSFNACRETCRELAYRYNLIDAEPSNADAHLGAMRRLAQHLVLFISGKMQEAQLGEFCCSSRALRTGDSSERGV